MPEILLITSLTTRRWILPKGWPVEGLSLADSAAREAFEEAGVEGEVGATPLASYHYLKERKEGGGIPCRVDVFGLQVTAQKAEWPERGAREIAWLAPDQAARRISEPGLRAILVDFHIPQRRAG